MTTRLILCVLLIIISPWLLAKELILLHTNDFHGHIQQEGKYAGAAKIAAFVKGNQSAAPCGIAARCWRRHLWNACVQHV